MPIREYECPKCKKREDRIERNNRVYGRMECEECNVEMEPAVGNSNFILKGDGWYKSDYAS